MKNIYLLAGPYFNKYVRYKPWLMNYLLSNIQPHEYFIIFIVTSRDQFCMIKKDKDKLYAGDMSYVSCVRCQMSLTLIATATHPPPASLPIMHSRRVYEDPKIKLFLLGDFRPMSFHIFSYFCNWLIWHWTYLTGNNETLRETP